MWQAIGNQLNPRSTVLSLLSIGLFLSLVCSMSMQQSRAASMQPLQAASEIAASK